MARDIDAPVLVGRWTPVEALDQIDALLAEAQEQVDELDESLGEASS